MRIHRSLIFVLAALPLMAGCSNLKSLTASKAAPEAADPLEVVNETSSEYRAAKKGLKDAEETTLSCALFREEQGDYEGAMQRYSDVLSDNPNSVSARLGVARVEMRTGRKAKALEIMEATVRKFPDSKEAWLALGRLHSSQGDTDKALFSFRRGVTLAPRDQMCNYELGLALIQADELDEAHQYLTDAVGDSAAYYNIGYRLHEFGRTSESLAWIQRALESKPDERTRVSAERLLSSINRAGQNTANVAQTTPRVNQQRTSYDSYTEQAGPSGFESQSRGNGAVGRVNTLATAAGQQSLPQRNSAQPATQHQQRPASTTTAPSRPVVTPAAAAGQTQRAATVRPVSGVSGDSQSQLPLWRPGGTLR